MLTGLGAGLIGAGRAVSFGASALRGRGGDALRAVRSRLGSVELALLVELETWCME